MPSVAMVSSARPPVVAPGSRILEMPKSSSLGTPSFVTSTFPGFRSLMDHHALVRELNRRAHLDEELQPTRDVEFLLGAVVGDRLPVDELHDEVGNALLRRATIEQARDVRMFQAREDLALSAQPAADEGRAGPSVHQLDGDLLLVFVVDAASPVDLAHAADADGFDELIRTAAAADHRALERLETERGMRRDVQEGFVGAVIRGEQRFHFDAELGICRAKACEVPRTLPRADTHRLMKGGFDLLPALGRHARKATRASHARSKHQRRLTTTSGE